MDYNLNEGEINLNWAWLAMNLGFTIVYSIALFSLGWMIRGNLNRFKKINKDKDKDKDSRSGVVTSEK